MQDFFHSLNMNTSSSLKDLNASFTALSLPLKFSGSQVFGEAFVPVALPTLD